MDEGDDDDEGIEYIPASAMEAGGEDDDSGMQYISEAAMEAGEGEAGSPGMEFVTEEEAAAWQVVGDASESSPQGTRKS